MNRDLMFWYVARAAAMAAFAVLAGSLLTGMAIRTAYLSGLARNRAVIALHTFLAWFWLPLVALHVVALLCDGASQIVLPDIVIPFRVSSVYQGTGRIAVGLGTIGFLTLVLITVTSALRRRMSQRLWLWLHRLTYPMFVVFLIHAQLGGTDFSRTAISVVAWATLGSLGMLALPRVAGGRLEQRR